MVFVRTKVDCELSQESDASGAARSRRERLKQKAKTAISLARANPISALSGAKSLQNRFLNA